MRLKKFFIKNYPDSDRLFTNTGRSALQAIVEDFKLQDSKMIISSFICSDVFSPLLIQNNITPILVDCPKKEFNITFNDIKKACDKDKEKTKIKSIVIVHTFGEINKEIVKIKRWCKNKKIILIEDCAHCINIKYNKKKVGEFGDTAVFSFPKTLETFSGGIYIKNRGKIRINPLPYKINNLDIYNFLNKNYFTRKLIDFMKSFKSKNKIKINPEELKISSLPPFFNLLKINFKKINIIKRREIAGLFYSGLKQNKKILLNKIDFNNNFFLSLPILVDNRDKVFNEMIKKGIKCNKMWTNPLSLDKNISKRYESNKSNKLNKTPNAEFFSKKIINISINPRQSLRTIKKNIKNIQKIINDNQSFR